MCARLKEGKEMVRLIYLTYNITQISTLYHKGLSDYHINYYIIHAIFNLRNSYCRSWLEIGICTIQISFHIFDIHWGWHMIVHDEKP